MDHFKTVCQYLAILLLIGLNHTRGTHPSENTR